MRTHYQKLGSLAVIGFAACATLHAPPTAAQSQNAQRCTTIGNDAERLACYDRALKPAPAPARDAPPAAAPSTTIATENRATRREREVRESTASAAPSASPPPAAPAAPAAPAPPVARRAPPSAAEDAADVVPIVIVQIRALPGRAATFVTDSGDTWVQTDNERRMPAVPFKASIKRGSMSSFFLVPDDYARSFRVRRGQ